MPYKNSEQKKQYMKAYREKHQTHRQEKALERKQEKEEMIRTINETISKLNPDDINCLLQLDSNLLKSYYEDFGDYRREFPKATFEDYQEYLNEEREWIGERKSERKEAFKVAVGWLIQTRHSKIKTWMEMFPKFFEKYGIVTAQVKKDEDDLSK